MSFFWVFCSGSASNFWDISQKASDNNNKNDDDVEIVDDKDDDDDNDYDYDDNNEFCIGQLWIICEMN